MPTTVTEFIQDRAGKMTFEMSDGSVKTFDPSVATSSGAVGPVVEIVTNTYGAIQDAYNKLVNDYGGFGTISLGGKSVAMQGPAPMKAGIKYAGWRRRLHGAQFLDNSVTFEGAELFASGANIGQFNCFEYNPNDNAVFPSTGGTATSGNIFPNSGNDYWESRFDLENINMRGFKNGIKFGAFRALGMAHTNLHGIWATECTEWGAWMENCQFITGSGLWMFTQNRKGGFMIQSSGGQGTNPGNSTFEHIFISKAGYLDSAGMEIAARGPQGGNNDILIQHLQVNGGESYTTTDKCTTSATPGDAWITVTNPAKYQVGGFMSVGSTAVAGLASFGTYVVRDVDVGNSKIRISNSYLATAYKVPTTQNTVFTALLQGYPLLAVRSYDEGNQIQPITIGACDLELNSNCSIYLEQAQLNILNGLIPPGRDANTTSSVMARGGGSANSDAGKHTHGMILNGAQNYLTMDFGPACNITYIGKHATGESGQGEYTRRGVGMGEYSSIDSPANSLGEGKRINPGDLMIQMRRSGPPSLFMTRSGSMALYDQIQLKHLELNSARGADILGWDSKCAVTLNYASPTTITLPTVYPVQSGGNQENVGLWFEITNAGAGTITFSAGGAQNIVGAGVSANTRTLAPNTSCVLIAKAIGATGYWAWDGENTVGGTSTQSGNAVQTVFTIAHGLGAAPSKFSVTPGSAAAALVFFATTDATNITVTYTAAPATGTNNVVLRWIAAL
jgi:hypothetical protein